MGQNEILAYATVNSPEYNSIYTNQSSKNTRIRLDDKHQELFMELNRVNDVLSNVVTLSNTLFEESVGYINQDFVAQTFEEYTSLLAQHKNVSEIDPIQFNEDEQKISDLARKLAFSNSTRTDELFNQYDAFFLQCNQLYFQLLIFNREKIIESKNNGKLQTISQKAQEKLELLNYPKIANEYRFTPEIETPEEKTNRLKGAFMEYRKIAIYVQANIKEQVAAAIENTKTGQHTTAKLDPYAKLNDILRESKKLNAVFNTIQTCVITPKTNMRITQTALMMSTGTIVH